MGYDATVEEVLHTINTCGHVDAYPQLYSLEPNSSYLTSAMDIARGGQWINLPDAYQMMLGTIMMTTLVTINAWLWE